MSIKRIKTTNFATFAEFIQENLVPSIFKAATYDSETGTLTCTDSEDNTALEIKGGSTEISNGYYFRAYRTAAGNYFYKTYNSFPAPSSNSALDVISCDNGMICTANVTNSYNYARLFCFLIAKTNNGKPAIIFGPSEETTLERACTNNVYHVALGDSATMSTTTTFIPESGTQTNFATFCTNADIMDVSYTPKAFFHLMHSSYNSGIGKFLSGGKLYITNGYWSIDTEEGAS